MEITDSEKAELFKKWDDSGVDLETYNNQIKEKVSKIELILEKSKWELENKVAEEGYTTYLAQKRNPSLHSSNKLEYKIHELENEKAKLETQILTTDKIHALENEKFRLETQILSDKKIYELENKNVKLETQILTTDKIHELENEKSRLEAQILSDKKIYELENEKTNLTTKLENSSENLQEAKQEKILLAKKADSREQTSFVMMKKYYSTIAIAGLIIGGFVGGFTLYQDSVDDNYVMVIGDASKSKYLIQNLFLLLNLIF